MERTETRLVSMELMNPAPYNPRVDLKPGDPEYQAIKKSIDSFGYLDPIIWNEDTGNIVGGHQRYKVLKDMGFTEVEAKVVHFDDATEKACNLALNKAVGLWDDGKLQELLDEMKGTEWDMTDFGFDMEIPADEVKEDDFDVDEALDEGDPISQPGQVWRLGTHRLMCGDSTNPDDVAKLMGGALADMVITDPPYNVAYEGNAGSIKNDDQSDEDFLNFLSKAFKNLHDFLRPGGAFYIWHAESEGYNFRFACKLNNLQVRECLIWNKNSLVMGRQDYQWKHEPCLYGWKEGAAHYFIDDRSLTTVLDYPKPARSEMHPTMKPIELFAFQINNSSKSNERVLDLFGGSGTTIMVCEQMKRRGYAMEFDPKYCDVIIKRWENATGLKAELIKE